MMKRFPVWYQLAKGPEPKVPDSGATSDEENEDGDFTVYECPGLAPVSPHQTVTPDRYTRPLHQTVTAQPSVRHLARQLTDFTQTFSSFTLFG